MTRSGRRPFASGGRVGTAAAALALTLAVLIVGALALAGCGKPRAEVPVPLPPSQTPLPTPPSPSPSPSSSLLPATSFVSDGDLIAGWYWLRDAAHEQTSLWAFQTIPSAPADIVLHLQVLATDRINGPRGIDAHFYVAWATPDAGGLPGPWLGRLPVTLPNVSPATDPVGYTCEGTLTIPRATLGDATRLVVQITRADPRGELPPLDTHVAVNRTSVSLRP
jgi:hypothetical protein